MPIFNIIIGITILSSILLYMISHNRVYAYNKRYRLPELEYTKLFRVIQKRHILYAYGIFVIVHVVLTIWFLWTL